jgi:hypothetical protein
MENREIGQRVELAIRLLHALEEANRDMEGLSGGTDAVGETALSDSKRESDDRIRVKRELLHQRIGELKTCLADITRITNEWHEFTHNPDMQRQWSYPARLYRLGRETNIRLKKEQDRISSLILQNRLLEEEIRRFGDTAQRDALSLLKGTSGHGDRMAVLERKQAIVDDLCLLLPTIPSVALCKLDPANPLALAVQLA